MSDYIPTIIHAEAFDLTVAASFQALLEGGGMSTAAAIALIARTQTVRVAGSAQDHVYLISPDASAPTVSPRFGEWVAAESAYSVNGQDNIERWQGIAVTGTCQLTVMFYG